MDKGKVSFDVQCGHRRVSRSDQNRYEATKEESQIAWELTRRLLDAGYKVDCYRCVVATSSDPARDLLEYQSAPQDIDYFFCIFFRIDIFKHDISGVL